MLYIKKYLPLKDRTKTAADWKGEDLTEIHEQARSDRKLYEKKTDRRRTKRISNSENEYGRIRS